MTLESRIDPEEELVFTTSSGRVDDADLVEHELWIGNQAEFKPHFSQIADARDVTENRVTPVGLIAIANITPFAATARRCYVVSTALSRGYSNLFGYRTSESSEHFKICEDLEEGKAWIEAHKYSK